MQRIRKLESMLETIKEMRLAMTTRNKKTMEEYEQARCAEAIEDAFGAGAKGMPARLLRFMLKTSGKAWFRHAQAETENLWHDPESKGGQDEDGGFLLEIGKSASASGLYSVLLGLANAWSTPRYM